MKNRINHLCSIVNIYRFMISIRRLSFWTWFVSLIIFSTFHEFRFLCRFRLEINVTLIINSTQHSAICPRNGPGTIIYRAKLKYYSLCNFPNISHILQKSHSIIINSRSKISRYIDANWAAIEPMGKSHGRFPYVAVLERVDSDNDGNDNCQNVRKGWYITKGRNSCIIADQRWRRHNVDRSHRTHSGPRAFLKITRVSLSTHNACPNMRVLLPHSRWVPHSEHHFRLLHGTLIECTFHVAWCSTFVCYAIRCTSFACTLRIAVYGWCNMNLGSTKRARVLFFVKWICDGKTFMCANGFIYRQRFIFNPTKQTSPTSKRRHKKPTDPIPAPPAITTTNTAATAVNRSDSVPNLSSTMLTAALQTNAAMIANSSTAIHQPNLATSDADARNSIRFYQQQKNTFSGSRHRCHRNRTMIMQQQQQQMRSAHYVAGHQHDHRDINRSQFSCHTNGGGGGGQRRLHRNAMSVDETRIGRGAPPLDDASAPSLTVEFACRPVGSSSGGVVGGGGGGGGANRQRGRPQQRSDTARRHVLSRQHPIEKDEPHGASKVGRWVGCIS